MNYLNILLQKIRTRIKNKNIYYFNKLIKTLYRLNFFIVNRNNKRYAGYFDKKKCFTKKIKVSNEFLGQVKNDLKIQQRDYYKGHKKNKFLYYDYPSEYLEQINLAWNIDRKKYCNFFNDHFGNLIRKIYNGNNYRVEHIFLYETVNKDATETYNVNSNFHTDGDLNGALKILVYLCDVNTSNGPFCYKEFDTDKNEKIFKVEGGPGTSVIFQQNECVHAAANTVEKKRTAISFLIYPSLRKKNFLYKEKPINTLCSLNPFTKYS
ncbi:hypothetical protein OAC71_03530 [Candidatus Thioglobus sp.]|nr:hypothetical protein [Candidatus Thioglobus sp.]